MRSCVSHISHLFVSISNELWSNLCSTFNCIYGWMTVAIQFPHSLQFPSLAPVKTIHFVNWEDVQLSESAAVSSWIFPSLLPFLAAPLCFAYYPRHGKASVQKHREQLFKQAEIFCVSIQIISPHDSLPSSCSQACD